ncbi:hypothetical protein EGR_10021 [Echinococcus granulosus]|uniref:Uncharacterized protein n=1 Tax=Echinococcus granulosus TaxID=6210 RepID=W6U9F0_ECHGR|nr:hypothetical protein EGR_10021 [Echinococcus granulosus]EUB55112.1 hypothetical protein EGR_10021 [Echinococcus granulosus]
MSKQPSSLFSLRRSSCEVENDDNDGSQRDSRGFCARKTSTVRLKARRIPPNTASLLTVWATLSLTKGSALEKNRRQKSICFQSNHHHSKARQLSQFPPPITSLNAADEPTVQTRSIGATKALSIFDDLPKCSTATSSKADSQSPNYKLINRNPGNQTKKAASTTTGNVDISPLSVHSSLICQLSHFTGGLVTIEEERASTSGQQEKQRLRPKGDHVAKRQLVITTTTWTSMCCINLPPLPPLPTTSTATAIATIAKPTTNLTTITTVKQSHVQTPCMRPPILMAFHSTPHVRSSQKKLALPRP